MRAAGIHGLVSLSCLGSNRFGSLAAYEQAEQVASHMTTVPDQNQHLAYLSQAVGVNNMQLLANRIGYDGPLELLSMWTCLFGGPTLRLFTRIEAKVTSKVMLERASCSQSMRTREQRKVEHDSRTLRAPCRAPSLACAITPCRRGWAIARRTAWRRTQPFSCPWLPLRCCHREWFHFLPEIIEIIAGGLG